MTKEQKDRLDYLLIMARSAALHLGIFKHHLNVTKDEKFLNVDRYQVLIILPGQKDPERIYSNMTYIACITFLDALKIAAKVVKQVKKEDTNFINSHIEFIKG